MFRYQHLSIIPTTWHGYDPHNADLKLTTLVKDFYRYSSANYLLWTDKSPVTISEVVRDALRPEDWVLVHAVDRSVPPSGWLPTNTWDWLNRSRNHLTGETTGNAMLVPPVPTGG
jgi:hypothetical protein